MRKLYEIEGTQKLLASLLSVLMGLVVGAIVVMIVLNPKLAAMVLSKGGHILNQNGSRYTNENIDGLLMSRHIGKKIRRAGGRTKGPSKRTKEQDDRIVYELEELIQEILQIN